MKIRNQDLREALGLTRSWCAERLGVSERVIQYREQTEKECFRQFLMNTYVLICKGKHARLPPSAITREMSRRALVDYFMNLE